MRSMKFLVAMAVLTAFVAGPVMAQAEAPATDGAMSSDSGTTKSTTSKSKKHKSKKHKKSGASSGAASSTTTGQ